jgi:hypothetical protein
VTGCSWFRRGTANTDDWHVHEHHGCVGMLSECLIWSETGRRVVIDGGVAQVLTGGDGGAAFCKLECWRVAGK